MKKFLPLFFGIATFASASLLAQPTLTASGCNPVIGDNLVSSNTNYVSPGSAGASQTWNLSSMVAAGTGTNTCINPTTTTYGSLYPSANIAVQASSGGLVSYLKTSSTATQNYGTSVTSGTVVINIVYSNPEDYLHFPFSFNNTYTDAFQATFTSAGSNYVRKGNTNVTADGWGTLTTPAGTFSNVMRIHFVQSYTDSTNISTIPYVNNYTNDEYMWYLNGNHEAIATVSSFTTASSFTTTVNQTGSYLNNVSVGIDEQSESVRSCKLYPNPAANNVNLFVTLAESQKVEIKTFNTLGMQVNATVSVNGIVGANDFKIDISTLPEGVYFAQIHLDGNLSTTRSFVVSK